VRKTPVGPPIDYVSVVKNDTAESVMQKALKNGYILNSPGREIRYRVVLYPMTMQSRADVRLLTEQELRGHFATRG